MKGTRVIISDNSGGLVGYCIHVYNKRRYASIGDLILVSVNSYNTQKKIKKGEMHLAFVIRTKFPFHSCCSVVKFSDNAVVLLSKKLLPLGTRLFGVSVINLRDMNRKLFLMLPRII
jgi:large subunit ribosomal protein L14